MKFDILIRKKINFFYYQKLMPILMILKDYKMVAVRGKDSKKYLQSKLTIDMNQLKNHKYYISAHCSVYGKVIGILILFKYNEGYAYLIRKDIVNFQVEELKKYSIFSKVSINTEENFKIIGLVGITAEIFLKRFFLNVPNKEKEIIIENNIIILLVNNFKKRYLLVFSEEKKYVFYEMLFSNTIIKNTKYWNLLDIELGFPIVKNYIKEKFLPQELGLQRIQGINFYKGCYQGQEVISRAYFKKIKNNFLCWMISDSKNILQINLKIEAKIKEKWMVVGKIIYILPRNNNFFYIQAVLSENVNKNFKFRVFSKENKRLVLKKIFYI